MNARAHEIETLRGDLYLCLSRAFLAPTDRLLHEAMTADLADELEELDELAGYGAGAEIADYRRQVAAVGTHERLLQVYSRLFLQPPRAVHINTGVYLDGGLNGGSVGEMEEWYRECGLERSGDFHDLSDHVAVQLEFVASLHARQAAVHAGAPAAPRRAGQFLGRFVSRWTPGFVADLEEAARHLEGEALPYLPLARLLAKAAARDAEAWSELPPAVERRERALDKARRKQVAKGVTAEDLAEIRRCLAAKGLDTDHLDHPYGARDEAYGWQRMTPPAPRKR